MRLRSSLLNRRYKCFYIEFLIVFSFELFFAAMWAMTVILFLCWDTAEEIFKYFRFLGDEVSIE